MPRKVKDNKPRPNENWIREEQLSGQRRKALKSAGERNRWEKGKVVSTIKHPTSPRCLILKYN